MRYPRNQRGQEGMVQTGEEEEEEEEQQERGKKKKPPLVWSMHAHHPHTPWTRLTPTTHPSRGLQQPPSSPPRPLSARRTPDPCRKVGVRYGTASHSGVAVAAAACSLSSLLLVALPYDLRPLGVWSPVIFGGSPSGGD
ncbi:hypothetical protein CCUS01_06013 [Colletotrichum cuscutae]|uniref:Uncharacterized protein n=1 Tax=Colletotrichum cuscutae TaxID=1209917 RepID=A0AAI9Y4F3_9PEZI|nr:hypothetical protein CCUS01_06013 [Colletotrichum cuscutae]